MIVDNAELVPGERILVVAVYRDLENLLGLGEILRILGRDQRVTKHRGDHRRVVRPLDRLAENRNRILGLAALQQNLTLQFEEERVVRIGREQRVGFGDRLIGVAAEMIGVSAGVMRGDALVALGIFDHGLACVDVAQQLRFHALEPRFQRRVDRLGPCGIALQRLRQC